VATQPHRLVIGNTSTLSAFGVVVAGLTPAAVAGELDSVNAAVRAATRFGGGLGHGVLSRFPGVELITDRGDDGAMAVLVVFGVIVLWWLATHGKGTAPGRLVAWLVAIAVLWVVVAVKNPSAASSLASGMATGASQAASGIGAFFGSL
jgi:hypothetical protein